MKLIKKNSRLKFETILFFTAEFDQKFFCKHLNRIVIFISTLAFQKYFLFKILKLFQYIFSHLNLIPNFFFKHLIMIVIFYSFGISKIFFIQNFEIVSIYFFTPEFDPKFFFQTLEKHNLWPVFPHKEFFLNFII